eukprot:7885350-Prorocentrum_lima.AAC.1
MEYMQWMPAGRVTGRAVCGLYWVLRSNDEERAAAALGSTGQMPGQNINFAMWFINTTADCVLSMPDL